MRHLLLQNSKVGGRLSNFDVVRKITETLETIWPKALFLLFEEECVRAWGMEGVGGRLRMEGKRNKGCW